jgi:hypothetical protein
MISTDKTSNIRQLRQSSWRRIFFSACVLAVILDATRLEVRIENMQWFHV